MRLPLLAAALLGLLSACSSMDSGGGSSFGSTFDTNNYVRSSDTNGTQRRPDVNRLYTQPSVPSIVNMGR
ncbi:hypothetical protein [uncultured Methylobacterium sp.]|jgi:hypothetical protein|uniref:hypothetical protein n=1 Tax=uncultured Methylobacterium sp. TaxID=157278 RepID=UPI00260407A1|nr:hypothetical protein [uncultured Methylobacterium sp.]